MEGVKCQALTDIGAKASYASITLTNHINKIPIQFKTKKIEILTSAITRKIKIYSVRIQDISCEFGFETQLNHFEKEVLLELPNPK